MLRISSDRSPAAPKFRTGYWEFLSRKISFFGWRTAVDIRTAAEKKYRRNHSHGHIKAVESDGRPTTKLSEKNFISLDRNMIHRGHGAFYLTVTKIGGPE